MKKSRIADRTADSLFLTGMRNPRRHTDAGAHTNRRINNTAMDPKRITADIARKNRVFTENFFYNMKSRAVGATDTKSRRARRERKACNFKRKRRRRCCLLDGRDNTLIFQNFDHDAAADFKIQFIDPGNRIFADNNRI